MEREFTTGIDSESKQEKLSEIELGDLLASVGNHEAKALTLILMSGGNIYTAADIYHKLILSQGDNVGWRTNNTLPFKYCSDSFEPIGLVAKETLDENLDAYGYQITKKGEELGIVLAGLLLDFSLRHNISLQDLFGSTHSSSVMMIHEDEDKNANDSSSKIRSPLTRFQIFYDLVTNPSDRISKLDLTQSNFGQHLPNIGRHLFNLSKANVLGYEATEQGQPRTYYNAVIEKIDDRPKPFKGQPTLTCEVFDILKFDPEREWTREDMTEEVKSQHQHEITNEKGFSLLITSVLSHLRNQGFATVRKFSKVETFYSEVTLDNKQREVLSELVNIIDKFASLDDQMLEKGRRLAFDIINNPELVRILMCMAREHSSNANRKSPEERRKQILSVILARPAISAKGIVSALEEQGEIVSQETVRRISKLLLAEGLVKSETKKGIMHFRVVEK